ncbi:MAG: prepilin-type N-terminal cleavage/methylation domain-containing protein, partial [Dehalococcoidia bacterium]
MNKKGLTLIETAISMFLIALVIVAFLEALHIGITGTTQVSRKTSALNLAKSQIEHTKSREYVAASGDLDTVYGLITTVEEISDTINYEVSGQVTNVSAGLPVQQITVNVGYLAGKDVELTGYKTGDGSLFDREPTGLLVTDNIKRAPTLPQGYGGFCLGTFRGYYHVFTVGTEGPASIHWKFYWEKTVDYYALFDLGAPIIALYEGTPSWVLRDSNGEVKKNAMIVRNQNGLWLADVAGIGDLPGPGAGEMMCSPCADDEMYEDEDNPIYYTPHHCDPHIILWIIPTNLGWIACLLGGSTGPYPCCGACKTGADEREDYFWRYHGSESSGYAEDTLVTGDLEPGTYTVLF